MPNEFAIIKEMLPFLIPLALVQLTLMVIAIIDLVRREHVTSNNKIIWVFIIIFINLIGPIIYLLFGRKDRIDDSN
ncbi:MAG: PLDc N-terminal domain-containing protein [Dehalococcoidales bacterium]|jgi:heme/copper-type cytochrome/quinol oxidase subunit 4|nr:PLDc N-terminal domain-containing protein [Dehalococcoidales bacterium]MDX9985862.1 PLDc N-terminal domain-containing protein [Dehalococcoidales bacterium]